MRNDNEAIDDDENDESRSIFKQRRVIFKELVKCGMDTQTLSDTDQYLWDEVHIGVW